MGQASNNSFSQSAPYFLPSLSLFRVNTSVARLFRQKSSSFQSQCPKGQKVVSFQKFLKLQRNFGIIFPKIIATVLKKWTENKNNRPIWSHWLTQMLLFTVLIRDISLSTSLFLSSTIAERDRDLLEQILRRCFNKAHRVPSHAKIIHEPFACLVSLSSVLVF